MGYFLKNLLKHYKYEIYYPVAALFEFYILKVKGRSVWGLRQLNDGLRNKTIKNDHITDDDIDRIANAFINAKKDQINQPKQFQIGGEWEAIMMKCHQELKTELENINVEGIKTILSNFARNKVSKGLSLVGSGIPNTIFEKLVFLNDFNNCYYVWKNLTSLPNEVLTYPREIGNFFGIEDNGKLMIQPALRLSYLADKICNFVRYINYPIIVEIGGGFGGIPHHILKHDNLKCTYIGFDIPEICVIASYFLMSNFPEKKVLLYDESNIKDLNLSEFDIILMPNFVIKDLPSRCCDLVFNSHSLTEMDYSTVKEYLQQINRLSRKYFFHANHEFKKLYSTPGGRKKRQVDLNNKEFELHKGDFQRIYRFPELIQNASFFFEEYSYFEYLYERKG